MSGFEWLNESAKKFAELQKRALMHSEFTDLWKKSIMNANENNKNDTFLILRSLSTLIKAMEDYGDDSDTCRNIFNKFVNNKSREVFETINLYTTLPEYIWYNTTEKGINLRPGLLEERRYEIPPAVTMADEDVHGVIVGRTGAGKSVFLNNLLINMMIEYAPWELELYLIDFKKVELSQYVKNKGKSPNVKACAATSEVRYALSLIQNIRDIMEDRETLFSRLGYTDIKDFRKENPNVIVPRIMLVADEFQQMFLYATGKQMEIIQDLLTAITRKGRATGIHLLFASQEMQGTGIQMSNFKIKFALPCSAEVSSAVIGNSAASRLENPSKENAGRVIFNNKSGLIEENKTYLVPLIEKCPLEEWLIRLHSLADEVGFRFTDSQKYYLEDRAYRMEDFHEFLLTPQIAGARKRIATDLTGQFFLSLFLGRSVVYNSKVYDIENVNIERGKNKNILVVSPNPKDLAYMQNLIAVNFATTNYSMPTVIHKYFHSDCYIYSYFDLNPAVSTAYPSFKEDVDCDDSDIYYDFDSFKNDILPSFQERKKVEYLLNKNCKLSKFFSEYANIRLSSIEGDEDIIKDLISNLTDKLEEYDLLIAQSERIISFEQKEDLHEHVCKQLIKEWCTLNNQRTYDYTYKDLVFDAAMDSISYYYRYKLTKDETGHRLPIYSLFTPYIVFFSGVDNIGKYDKEFIDFISNCMDVNMYCVFFASGKVETEIKSACNYFFVGGSDKDLYENYIGYSTARTMRSITMDARIKSISRTFAFKKYKVNEREAYFSEFDIDKLMSEI